MTDKETTRGALNGSRMKHLNSVPKPAVKETARAVRNGDILRYARV